MYQKENPQERKDSIKEFATLDFIRKVIQKKADKTPKAGLFRQQRQRTIILSHTGYYY